MVRTLLFLFLIALFGTGGDISLSHAMKRLGEAKSFRPRALLAFAAGAARLPFLWLGILLLACAFFSFLSLLSWQPVSFVLPASALGFVVGAFAARFVLGEDVDPTRWAGVVIVCIGMVLLWMGQDGSRGADAITTVGRYAVMVLACAPLGYYLAVIFAAHRFFGRVSHGSGGVEPDFSPPVSILKPVRGLDREAHENFASFCRLDYREYEILFAVSDAGDPAVPVIEKLMAEFPAQRIRLLIGAANLGPNEKVCKLARLAREARYEYLAISDADVRVEADYLREVIEPLHNPRTGAVTALYRGMTDGQIGARLDAIGASGEFSGGVLIAREFGRLGFAMGSTIAVSRARLEEIGGLQALADLHSDDYELGHRIAQRGYDVELAAKPVWMVYPGMRLAQYLRHELRWQIGIRNIQPWGHAGLLFTQGLPLALAAAVVAPSRAIAGVFVAAYLVLRMLAAWVVGVSGLKDPALRRNFWLLPLRDALAFAMWCASFVSNTIHWGGLKFTLEHGRMLPVRPPTDSARFALPREPDW